MIAGISAAPPAFVRPEGAGATPPGAGAVPAGNDAENSAGAPAARRVQPASESAKPKGAGDEQLSEEEKKQVDELKQRDREVRAHEEAHARVGGSYASAPSYEFTTGPDGKRYATSGEVQIDSAPVKDNPEATVRKMDVVIRAALAPADPSPQDLQVARKAQMERAKAQTELQKQREAELGQGRGSASEGTAAPGGEVSGDARGGAREGGAASRLLQAGQAYGFGRVPDARELARQLFSGDEAFSLVA